MRIAAGVSLMPTPIIPPFTAESAARKVQVAEDLWNTRDPERVVLAYTVDSEWRNRAEFLSGREQIKAFLHRKWTRELDYRLKKTLWTFNDNRIAVSFEYEWHDDSSQWFRSYGIELWDFNPEGFMRRRVSSINDADQRGGEAHSLGERAQSQPVFRVLTHRTRFLDSGEPATEDAFVAFTPSFVVSGETEGPTCIPGEHFSPVQARF
jgi:uncharacterized protein